MGHRVEPGLYAVGRPSPDAPVLVSANYRLSFDRLRSQLRGIDARILVLDTQAVNVWCAAGKGSFGTGELVQKIEQTGLAGVVSHRTVIVPQLGAPGIAAHEVKKRTGFRVVYGPVRAEDLPEFLKNGFQATETMRRVRFSFWDRLTLLPIEWITSAKWLLGVAAILVLLAGFGSGGYSWSRAVHPGAVAAAAVLAGVWIAHALGVALLPWLPSPAFSLKGCWTGLAVCAAMSAGGLTAGWFGSWAGQTALWLLLPALASILLLKFTGATTYTSLSGVRKEIRIALPIQLAAVCLGLIFWTVGLFL